MTATSTGSAPAPAAGGGDRVGEALPGYEVSGELGRGAMGEVLAGRHMRLERAVAIKRLPRVFADDPDVRARFAAEAKVLASLSHPHVVPVYDYVEERGLCLLVMESLPGGTVWDRFTAEGLSMPSACAVAVSTCAGLQHAHDKHVLHRDVKPENLMFDGERVLKVTDFGIATALGGDQTLATLDGQVIGTPAYMAPEQAEGQPAGPPADVYAAGTMLYELLSGRLPFSDEGDALALLRRRVTEPPEPLDQVAPTVPTRLVEVVMTAIAERPEDRYPSAQELGVAVAAAAAEAWGPGWLEHTELPLLSGGAISAAATTGGGTAPLVPGPSQTSAPVRPSRPGAASKTRRRSGPPAAEDDASSLHRRTGEAPAPAPGTVMRGETVPGGPPPPERVRPTVARRTGAPDLGEIDERDLVPVSDILTPPPAPRRALALVVLLGLALLLVGLVAPGQPSPGPAPAGGRVTVGGHDLADGGSAEVDLSQPVPVVVEGFTGGALVSIDTSVAGLPAGSSSIEELGGGPGERSAAVNLSSLRRVTSGSVPAELRLTTEDGEEVLTHRLTLDQQDPQLLNGTVVAAAAVTLFVAVYLLSVTRPLRLGRRRPSAYPGLAALGAFAGVAVSLWGWALRGPAPTGVSLVVAAALGACAGPLLGWCLFVSGRRRRLRRAVPA